MQEKAQGECLPEKKQQLKKWITTQAMHLHILKLRYAKASALALEKENKPMLVEVARDCTTEQVLQLFSRLIEEVYKSRPEERASLADKFFQHFIDPQLGASFHRCVYRQGGGRTKPAVTHTLIPTALAVLIGFKGTVVQQLSTLIGKERKFTESRHMRVLVTFLLQLERAALPLEHKNLIIRQVLENSGSSLFDLIRILSTFLHMGKEDMIVQEEI